MGPLAWGFFKSFAPHVTPRHVPLRPLLGPGGVHGLPRTHDAGGQIRPARNARRQTVPVTASERTETDFSTSYWRAGWPLRRVLTDGGSEFKGPFAEACRALGIRHTRTQPRHAWTNGFVERLQGTILHEHWRIEFRHRYFTSRAAMQRSLDAFMRFYTERRPHQGYRVKGHTPAELFWGVVPAAG